MLASGNSMKHQTLYLRILVACSIFLSGGISLVPSADAQPVRRPSRPIIRKPASKPVEPDSMMAKLLKSKSALRSGSIASLGSRRVQLSAGKTMTIASIATSVFAEQGTFLQQARMSGVGLMGGASQSDEVHELPDSYVLSRRTAVVVSDPASFARSSPLFRDFHKSQSGAIKAADLGSEGKRGLAAFKRSELPKLPATHPLVRAAARGDDALLAAVVAGYGDFEIIDTVHIPKKAPAIVDGKLMAPKLINGVSDYGQLNARAITMSRTPIGAANLTQGARDRIGARFDSLRTVHTHGGVSSGTAEFLAGFTVSDSWTFERTIRFTSGFFRIKAGAHYAFGLRIPLIVNTRMTNIRHCEDRPTNTESSRKPYSIELSVETKQADEAYYRRVGLEESAIAKGHELALEAGAGYGYKLRLAWTTVANRPYRELGFDEGFDFKPPLGTRSQALGALYIPPDLTHTKFRSGPLRGSIEIGFQLEAKGDVDVVFSPYTQRVGGPKRAAAPKSLPRGASKETPGQGPANRGPFNVNFTSTRGKSFDFLLGKAANNDHAETNYGFAISKPSYHSVWTVTPGIRIRASARKWGYGFSYSRSIWFPKARVPIGELTLRRHRGTTPRFADNSGKKIFHKNTDGQRYCAVQQSQRRRGNGSN